MIVYGKFPTIKSSLSVVNTCLDAMNFDKIMLDLVENVILEFTFSIKDPCYIWDKDVHTEIRPN